MEIDRWQAPATPAVERDQILIMADDERMSLHPDERSQMVRTLGCYLLIMVVRSRAKMVSHIIGGVASRSSERQGRLIDPDRVGSMNKNKREGYF